MTSNKYWITHGRWIKGFGTRTRKGDIYIPLSLKLNYLLQKKAEKFKTDIIEFSYGRIPDKHIAVITIVHPLDHFIRKVGYKIINERLKWAEELTDEGKDINYKSWAYVLIE